MTHARFALAPLALAASLALSGCANFQTLLTEASAAKAAASAASQYTIPGKDISAAVGVFNTLENSAEFILKVCTPASRPAACNDPDLKAMNAAVRSGRAARDGLLAFGASHPGALGPSGLYQAIEGAISTIKAAKAAYDGAKAS